MNALSNTKCTRLLVAIGLCLILAAPAMLLWASRAQSPAGDEEDAFIAKLMEMDARKMATVQLPAATLRPAGFAVFGEDFKTPRRVHGDPRGLLRTNIADIDPKNAEAALRDLPADLRFADDEMTRLGANGRLVQGLDYLMLRPEAIAAKGLDAVLDGIRRDVTSIVDYRANSTLLAYVEASQIGKLRQTLAGSDAQQAQLARLHHGRPARRFGSEVDLAAQVRQLRLRRGSASHHPRAGRQLRLRRHTAARAVLLGELRLRDAIQHLRRRTGQRVVVWAEPSQAGSGDERVLVHVLGR